MYQAESDSWFAFLAWIANLGLPPETDALVRKWLYGLRENPRQFPALRDDAESEVFDIDIFDAFIPGTNICLRIVVDEENHSFAVVNPQVGN